MLISVDSADPLISPGEVSAHLHTIIGGNGFNFTHDFDQARASTCSSCRAKADNSAYWNVSFPTEHTFSSRIYADDIVAQPDLWV